MLCVYRDLRVCDECGFSGNSTRLDSTTRLLDSARLEYLGSGRLDSTRLARCAGTYCAHARQLNSTKAGTRRPGDKESGPTRLARRPGRNGVALHRQADASAQSSPIPTRTRSTHGTQPALTGASEENGLCRTEGSSLAAPRGPLGPVGPGGSARRGRAGVHGSHDVKAGESRGAYSKRKLLRFKCAAHHYELTTHVLSEI